MRFSLLLLNVGFLKIEYTESMEDYLYNKYFLKKIEGIIQEPELVAEYKKLNITS